MKVSSTSIIVKKEIVILKPTKLETVMQRKVNRQVEVIIQERSEPPSLNGYAKESGLNTNLKKSKE